MIISYSSNVCTELFRAPFLAVKGFFSVGIELLPCSEKRQTNLTDHFSFLRTEIIKLWVFTLILTRDRDTNKLRNIFTVANKITETSLVTELEQ